MYTHRPVTVGGHAAILLSFDIPGGVITPAEAAASVEEAAKLVDPKIGVVLSGRGPVWLFGLLIHELHPTAWVATHDPRLGAVVVQSHTQGVTAGDVFPID